MTWRSKCFILLAVVVLILTGCSGSDVAETNSKRGEKLNTKIKSIGKFETTDPYRKEKVIDQKLVIEEKDGQERYYKQKTIQYKINENAYKHMSYDTQVGMVWPGNIIQGESLKKGILNNIPLARKPMTLSLAVVSSGADKRQVTVDNPSYSSANQAMNQILNQYQGTPPAKTTFNYSAVDSIEELNYKLNAGFAETIDLEGEISGSKFDKKNVVVVNLTQEFFSMVVDQFKNPTSVFGQEVSSEDLDPYIGRGNPPCYIDQVAYGRNYKLIYSSRVKGQKLKAAIKASFDFLSSIDGGAAGNVDYKDVMNKTEVKVIQIGGNPQNGLVAGLATPTSQEEKNKLKEFITEGATFDQNNVGAPISYRVRYLKDSTFAAISQQFEYKVTEKIPVESPLKFPDAALEKLIRIEIGQQIGPITTADVKNVRRLDLQKENLMGLEQESINSLSGIQYFKNLNELNINGHGPLTGLNYLSNLEYLSKLKAADNNIDDISYLSELNNLTVLNLNHNNLKDLAPITNLTSLEELYLKNNNLKRINSLLTLDSLEKVNLANNDLNKAAQEDIKKLRQQGVKVVVE